MKKLYIKHGDVLLFKVDKLPDSANKIKIENEFVVERGEGVHTHIIPKTENLDVLMSGDDMYLNVLKTIEETVRGRRKADQEVLVPVYSL